MKGKRHAALFAIFLLFEYNISVLRAVSAKLASTCCLYRFVVLCSCGLDSQEGRNALKDNRPVGPTPNEQITVLMERGMAAARAGQRARARRYFAAVLEIDPSNEGAWFERAAVVDDPQERMAHLARVLALDPNHQRARDALQAVRQVAGDLAVDSPARLPPVATFSAPIPRPLLPMADVPRRRRGARAWVLLALLPIVLILALALWSDAPGTVVAALLPPPTYTPTPTFTPTPTATPTFTPTSTPTRTPTFTPSPTPTSTPTATPTSTPTPTNLPPDKSESGKWIEVDLSEQRLYAHEGQKTVLTAVVSTGTRYYPTVKGRFKIYVKYRAAPMSGPGYYLPGVPWVMYFYGGYAIHGTYWHHNFGTPMSHGCVNMKTDEAKWLYNWAPKGTLVVVHQ
jgi:lipoprotein-anchoring transpeptidase ErfK/SrfK